jgi:hypothetical protein
VVTFRTTRRLSPACPTRSSTTCPRYLGSASPDTRRRLLLVACNRRAEQGKDDACYCSPSLATATSGIMPRPKRSRVVSTSAKRQAPSEAAAAAQSSEPSTDIYDVSDGEKEASRLQRSAAPFAQMASITGGSRQASAATAALEASRQRRDSAMQRLENMASTSATGNTIMADEEQSDSGSDGPEVGRRAMATPVRGARAGDMSGLDLDDDLFAGLDTTFSTMGPASAQRSNETSSITASQFKRRPRASSFLSRDHGQLRPSSRAGPNTPSISSAFNIGLFKRRAREPSILGTAQKQRPGERRQGATARTNLTARTREKGTSRRQRLSQPL